MVLQTFNMKFLMFIDNVKVNQCFKLILMDSFQILYLLLSINIYYFIEHCFDFYNQD